MVGFLKKMEWIGTGPPNHQQNSGLKIHLEKTPMEVPCRFQAWRTVRMIDRGYPSAAKVLARRSGSSAVIRYKFVACYKFRLTAFCYSGEWKLLQNNEKIRATHGSKADLYGVRQDWHATGGLRVLTGKHARIFLRLARPGLLKGHGSVGSSFHAGFQAISHAKPSGSAK